MTTTERVACEEALRLLAMHLDRELDTRTHAQVEQHLATCRSCYSRAEFEGRLRSKVAELGSEPVRQQLGARVHKLIRNFTVADGD